MERRGHGETDRAISAQMSMKLLHAINCVGNRLVAQGPACSIFKQRAAGGHATLVHAKPITGGDAVSANHSRRLLSETVEVGTGERVDRLDRRRSADPV